MSNLFLMLTLLTLALNISIPAAAGKSEHYQIETIVEGLDRPYGIAFLPEGDLLVTEKPGRLRVISGGRLLTKPVSGVSDVYVGRQGGLLDIALHPRFSENHWVYLSLTQGTSKASSIQVYRGSYNNSHLSDVIKIYTAVPAQVNSVGFGARLAFLPDETLLLTVGEGFEYREESQNLGSSLGKIIRVADDGQIPQDNPFLGQDKALPEVWSYGHRVTIGLFYDVVTNALYAHENGPAGGDELNLIKPGKNYGWPIATYGLAYSGAYVTPFTHYPGTEQPLIHWTPSLAPSGLTLCRGCQWPEWEGDLFVGMLAGQQVRRLDLHDGTISEQEALFGELGERIRDARFGPDGALYLLTDSAQGRLLKVSNVIVKSEKRD